MKYNIIGHVLGHEEERLYIIIEGKINGKRNWGRPNTSYIRKIVSDTDLTNYKESKELVGNRDEWRNYLGNCKTNLRVDHKKKKINIIKYAPTLILCKTVL